MEYILFVSAITVTYAILARLRTRRANQNTGCVACESKNLQPTTPGKVECLDCGYEGDIGSGGMISENEVKEFTN